MKSILFAICAFFACTCSFAQISHKVVKERKKMVRRLPKDNPVIRLDDIFCKDVKEFIYYPDSICHTIYCQAHVFQGEQKPPMLIAESKDYVFRNDSIGRQMGVRDYRIKEMNFFFGSDEPLILYGDKKITRKEFYDLPEKEVAFVNYYFSDFVKTYYDSIGASKGIVYACPRKTPCPMRFHSMIPYPADGRNFLWPYLDANAPHYDKGKGYDSKEEYIRNTVSLYNNSLEDGTKGTVVVSCMVDTDGKISPLFVERLTNYNEIGERQKDKLIEIALEIINYMPAWSPGFEILFDPTTHENWCGNRESSISLEIPFRKIKK